jgi:two-component system, OmpR family, sensor histidine kinase ChvG
MAPDTVLPEAEPRGLFLHWSGRLSLRQRILAVNVFALALLAGSVFYLDSYRTRLIDERTQQAANEAQLVAMALEPMSLDQRRAFIGRVGAEDGVRLRLADTRGAVVADSWAETGPNFNIRDPATEPWQRIAARWLDDAIDFVADAQAPARFNGFAAPGAWRVGDAGWMLAPDRTHMIWAATLVDGPTPLSLMSERNARDIRRLVRAERSRLGYIILAVTLLSVLLSLFLARTIAEPLRNLAAAALRVRYGRDREVNVPRLPSRNDEIGRLARALSDMTHALRQRMDATEAFAADVSHEMKNPLASLSSATETLGTVKDPALRDRLLTIISEDVRRLNRLITDISDLSRIDARLARTRFEPVDVGQLIETLIADRTARFPDHPVKIAFARPHAATTLVRGDPAQLIRVIENLLANAISFSPPEGIVRIDATRTNGEVMIVIDDEGPGIPESAREAIFERFHSRRPEEEAFGQHSGLGLSIARTIVNGHAGTISAAEREPGQTGARMIVRLPALEDGTK